MDREKQFAQILSDTLILARRQKNRITHTQIETAFAPLSFNDAQFAELESYFATRKIAVLDTIAEQVEPGRVAQREGLREEQRSAHLKAYLDAVNKKRRLTDAEAKDCYERVMAGDRAAQHEMIEHFLPLVADIARLYEEQGVYPEDLIGEGNVALVTGVTLLEATESFEQAEEALSQMMMNAMEDLIRRTTKAEADDRKALNRVQEVADKARELAEEYRRDLTVEELLEETGWDRAQVEQILRITPGGIEGLTGVSPV
ncbi:MAG: hypothetical protein IJP92_03030 [Lachnospiraceae bacterium]|nr:hypothetical protein [Lachnospiraceae bacterium]